MEFVRSELQEFGMGLLAALCLQGVNTLSKFPEEDLDNAFKEVLSFASKRLREQGFLFSDESEPTASIHNVAEDLLDHWVLTGWATRESDNKVFKLKMKEETASMFVNGLPGGLSFYLQAAQVFKEQYNRSSL